MSDDQASSSTPDAVGERPSIKQLLVMFEAELASVRNKERAGAIKRLDDPEIKIRASKLYAYQAAAAMTGVVEKEVTALETIVMEDRAAAAKAIQAEKDLRLELQARTRTVREMLLVRLQKEFEDIPPYAADDKMTQIEQLEKEIASADLPTFVPAKEREMQKQASPCLLRKDNQIAGMQKELDTLRARPQPTVEQFQRQCADQSMEIMDLRAQLASRTGTVAERLERGDITPKEQAAFEAGIRFHMSDPTQAELCAGQASKTLASSASAPAHTPVAIAGTSNSSMLKNEPLRMMREGGYQEAVAVRHQKAVAIRRQKAVAIRRQKAVAIKHASLRFRTWPGGDPD
ncbi:uncharacterized protein MKK02DRAFT_32290 [Dioszegia hungarica]|uniref:Uncharacterized protein n=1 Tax=Dioszegia hungarica TaxID=4972 RepID=A0AA38HCB1_9TREE|nr:uncharacterized protein MKK02DRAFT_32290 [Dioszegia hungarica]KAI9637447.1 hypothetical protein MKK02DRAFT_32290 [Dioszegia hungarica]